MIVHACNTNTGEAEDFKLEASLGYRERPCLKKKKKKKAMFYKNEYKSQAWWCMPIILATWEAEVGGS
jgi:hypothetical protein